MLSSECVGGKQHQKWLKDIKQPRAGEQQPDVPADDEAQAQARGASDGGFDPSAATNEPDTVNGNDGYGEDQSEVEEEAIPENDK